MSQTRLVGSNVACTCLLGTSSCPVTPPTPGGNEENPTLVLFDDVLQAFDENYSYFDYKGIDWDDVRTRYRPNFNQTLTGDQFVDLPITPAAGRASRGPSSWPTACNTRSPAGSPTPTT